MGDAAWDVTFVVPTGDFDEKSVALESVRGLGGTGANAAAAAARLGSDVRLFATVGTDQLAEAVVDGLQRAGIDTSGVVRSDGHTSTVAIVIRGDERQVIVDPGVAREVDQLDVADVLRDGVIYLSNVPIRLADRIIRSMGPDHMLIVGVDGGQLKTGGSSWIPLLRSTQVLVLNERANQVLDELAGSEDLTAEGSTDRPAVVITHGAAGVDLLEPDGTHSHFPATKVEAVDATGAGDCLAGALAHYLRAGESLSTAVQLGNVAAGISTTRRGAQTAFPTESELLRAAPPSMTRGVRLQAHRVE